MDISLVENIPLDIEPHARLLTDKRGLELTWPDAHFPFDQPQWLDVMNPADGHKPFLVIKDGIIIGQAALRLLSADKTDHKSVAADTYSVNFVYIAPYYRERGYSKQLLALLEIYAVQRLNAAALYLVVRDYNAHALACYISCEFKEYNRDGSLIKMHKHLRQESSADK